MCRDIDSPFFLKAEINCLHFPPFPIHHNTCSNMLKYIVLVATVVIATTSALTLEEIEAQYREQIAQHTRDKRQGSSITTDRLI